MDFSKIKVVSAANAGASLEILDPHTLEDTGVRFTVLGYDSEAVTERSRQMVREKAEGKHARTVDVTKVMVEQRVELALAAVTGWENFGWEGEDNIAFDRQLLRQILEDPEYYWLVTAIDRFGNDRGNYGGATKSN